ncbi:DUF4296 domain-containing protein [Crocinitomicaceae bacterium]|nr:DUF4296 domain-containing protein [Crocinitomicaceae bacterium]
MIRVLFIALIFFSACSPGIDRVPEPKGLIDRQELIPLLTEMTKLEGHVTQKFNTINKYHKIMTSTGDSLLEAYGFTNAQFEASMDYYISRQEEMISIYDQVLENLNEELGKIESSIDTLEF